MTMTHEQLLDSMILPAWRAALSPGLGERHLDDFLRRNRPAIVRLVGSAWTRKLWADGLTTAKKRLAASLARDLENGAPLEEVLESALDLQTPGALDLATDLAALSEAERAQRRRSFTRILLRGARQLPANKQSAPADPTAAPDEARTPAKRAKKNLAAMELAAALEESGERVDEDARAVLRGYSGWGGLSLKRYGEDFPQGWDPESAGLIHEYYTPSIVADAIAEAVCPMLESVATPLGELHALEPSAGIGRFIDAFDRARCGKKPALNWTAVEFSDSSARLLRHIRPDVEVEHGTFETWVRNYGSAVQGEVGLIVANPPYGERGIHAAEDPDPFYSERAASDYFLRRGLDLLALQGIGVFLVPGGFLTGKTKEALRRKVLRRHHLAAAVRMPKRIFPGTSARLDIDLLIFRSRGGELAQVDEGDRFILDGGYFKKFPNHDLSGSETFTGLPAFNERPQCEACVVSTYSWKRVTARPRSLVVRSEESDFTKTLSRELRDALGLGARVQRYLAANAAGEPTAVDMYAELRGDLEGVVDRVLVSDGSSYWHQCSLAWPLVVIVIFVVFFIRSEGFGVVVVVVVALVECGVGDVVDVDHGGSHERCLPCGAAIREVHRLRREVPGDLAQVGVGRSPSALSHPLTGVAVIGESATEKLERRLLGLALALRRLDQDPRMDQRLPGLFERCGGATD